jgi:hypothetical protein
VADVDAMGVAWVAGSGHIRGYWTQGQHLDPVTGKVQTATACDPVPYGGGNVAEGQLKVQGGVIHNTGRNLNVSVDGRPGDAIAATEEVNVTDCKTSGRFLTYDLGGSYTGQSWTPSGKDYTLRRLDAWTPENQPGSSGCDSAHWFTDRGDGLIAIAFYTQGTRLLDIRNPRHIREVGFFNVQNTNTWAAYWHGDNYIYVADFQGGSTSSDTTATWGQRRAGPAPRPRAPPPAPRQARWQPQAGHQTPRRPPRRSGRSRSFRSPCWPAGAFRGFGDGGAGRGILDGCLRRMDRKVETIWTTSPDESTPIRRSGSLVARAVRLPREP